MAENDVKTKLRDHIRFYVENVSIYCLNFSIINICLILNIWFILYLVIKR